MRRTSPVPHSSSGSGFSLLELLIAVLILSILIAAAARGLMSALQSDEASMLAFEGELLRERIETSMAHTAGSNAVAALISEGWTFREIGLTSNEAGKVSWRVFSLESARRPSLCLRGAIRAD